MKIEKLVIYGFGQHENVTLEFGRGVNVLYGQNESGKTTIQQFILHVLFGFPPRNSTLLRYEPASGREYGGQIHLQDEIYGKCIVERVRGKSAGDVNVYFEDGTIGTEDELRKLLRGYDRASFESIFSFSLLQLQGFEKMNEQELSRTLLASGTTGVDYLLQVEATMEKEMERLFKKSGRNPALNQKLTELRKLEASLHEAMNKANQYAPTVKRLKEVEEELAILYTKKIAYEQDLRMKTTEQQQLPLYRQRAQLNERHQQLSSVCFPVDGIHRYESVIRQMDETEAALVTIQRECEQLEKTLEAEIDETKLEQLEQLLEKESNWHRLLSKVASLRTEREELLHKESEWRARLGVQGEVNFLVVDVSLRREEELYELLENLQHAHRELPFIETRKAEKEEEMKRVEIDDEQLTPPSEEERTQAKKWPKIRQRIAEEKAYRTIHAQQQKQFQLILLGLALFTALILGYSLISKQYGLLFIAVLGALSLLVLKSRQQTDGKEMGQWSAAYAGREEEMERLAAYVASYDEEKESRKVHRRNIAIEREQLFEDHAQIEREIEQIEQSLEMFLAQYGIDGLPSANIIPELFRIIRDLQEMTRRLERIETARTQVELDIVRQQEAGEQILQRTVPKEALYEWLRQTYKTMTDDAGRVQYALKKKEQLEKEAHEKNALMNLLREQIERLFTEAAVQTEEAYYGESQLVQEKVRINEQLDQLTAQLIDQGPVDLSLTDDQLENMMEEIKEQIGVLTKRENELVEEKAILLNKTDALLSDEVASKLQQQFEIERAEFITLAKKWASKKALASAIQQMMRELKEKKFPAVLQEAEQLFKTLTNARYETMQLTEEGYFEVVTKNGRRFSIVQLSQATKEQAYISLRLALAKSLQKGAPFPIIMDDPFVHFDEQRLSYIIQMIEQFTTHQFIYFTCQETMKNNWRNATTINVSTIGNNRGANVG